MIPPQDLKAFLDEKVSLYNCADFIENDPVQIPHRFTKKEDVEIAAFLTATISWGNRKAILKSADKILAWMDHSPHEFIVDANKNHLKFLEKQTVHRTLNGEDLAFFVMNLQRLYREPDSLEPLFALQNEETNYYHALHRFRSAFFSENLTHRSSKHISSTYKNASAKRLMMFLRWMVRQDNRGVDLGIWHATPQKYLSIPLDVHSGNISRQLGLLSRKQNDWKAVEELDLAVRNFDPEDPAKYDFALFGLGFSGDF